MAYADGQMDDSELRVIRDYMRAWGVDSARVSEWMELYSFAESNRFERLTPDQNHAVGSPLFPSAGRHKPSTKRKSKPFGFPVA